MFCHSTLLSHEKAQQTVEFRGMRLPQKMIFMQIFERVWFLDARRHAAEIKKKTNWHKI